MADISYLQNEDLPDTDEAVEDKDDEEISGDSESSDGCGDGSGDEGGGVEGDEGGGGGEQLSALAKLQQHAGSQTIFNRQMVGRVLVDIFRNAVDTGIQLPIEEMMIPIGQITVDPEASVRSELVEQVPNVAMICQEAPNRFRHVLPQHLLGIVIKYLRDDDNQVRKNAHAALLALMERGLLDKEPIEQLICPIVLSYVDDSTVDIHTGAITLMCKMAPLVGREITQRLFLDRFAKLCSDDIFYVRKVCAANLADFCAAVSKESIENILLPRFIDLCTDDVWGVRKACAEVIMSVSCCVSLDHRQLTLAPVFAALLGDVSRWVRMSAFQTLGPFISTFAQQFTGLAYNQYGEVVFTNQQGTELRYNKLSYLNPQTTHLTDPYIIGRFNRKNEEFEAEECNSYNKKPVDQTATSRRRTGRRNSRESNYLSGDSALDVNEEPGIADDIDKFNPFLYYYISPEMPLDLDLVEAGRSQQTSEENTKKAPPSLESESARDDENSNENLNNSTSVDNSSEIMNDTVDVYDVSDNRSSTPIAGDNFSNKYGNSSAENFQCIVPQVLIDYFVSMTEATQVVETDSEIPHHCAFSFPAVALTLGRQNWSFLKDAYLSLASAIPWKVRRTLASSIHEVAIILGEDLAARDLVPIYDGFIKDLDEVRIGALKHLATFLKVLRPAERCQYLPRLNDFLVTDNEWNWRFREELANQLLEAVTLFNPYDVSKYIAPLSLHLLVDKIAAVRTVALALITQIISHLSVDEALVTALVQELGDMLPRSVKWTRRQTYGILCSQLITNGAITADRFSREMLPHLIDLSWDTVPNVRLAVARTLARNVATRGPEWQGGPEQAEAVKTKLKHLRQDVDRDVREHAVLIRSQ